MKEVILVFFLLMLNTSFKGSLYFSPGSVVLAGESYPVQPLTSSTLTSRRNGIIWILTGLQVCVTGVEWQSEYVIDVGLRIFGSYDNRFLFIVTEQLLPTAQACKHIF